MAAEGAAAAAAAKDEFSDAKTNLRDTVKWLATTYAALAAFVVAGSSVSGLGALAWDSRVFVAAAAALFVGFACVSGAMMLTLRLLRPVQVYRSDLLHPQQGGDESEMRAVRRRIDAKGSDVLPLNYQRLADIAKALRDIDDALRRLGDPPPLTPRAAQKAEGLARRARIHEEVNRLLPLALYLRLQERLQRALPSLFALGVGALLSLAGFGFLTHPAEKKSEGVSVTSYIAIAASGAASAPGYARLPPVLFAPGSADIDAAALKSLQAIRDAVEQHPGALALVLARTDTRASKSYNAGLANRRARAVVGALTGAGGIAPRRVFSSELPETALPHVTRDEEADAANRSVEVVLVPSGG